VGQDGILRRDFQSPFGPPKPMKTRGRFEPARLVPSATRPQAASLPHKALLAPQGDLVMMAATGFAFLIFLAAPAAAQWLKYPTAGVTKTAAGAPNLQAPAPRAADGNSDLSGVWVDDNNRPCPPNNCDDMLTSQEFWDIGWGLRSGIPYQPWAADLIKQRTPLNGREDPTGHCLPGGIVKLHSDPLFRKIVQTPD
jgi:hypothetical protein